MNVRIQRREGRFGGYTGTGVFSGWWGMGDNSGSFIWMGCGSRIRAGGMTKVPGGAFVQIVCELIEQRAHKSLKGLHSSVTRYGLELHTFQRWRTSGFKALFKQRPLWHG